MRAGQTIVIPLRIRNAVGVYANGYQTIPILCYHRFGSRESKLNVTPAAFEAQMEYLARNGYTVIPLKRLARFLEGKEPLPAKTVAHHHRRRLPLDVRDRLSDPAQVRLSGDGLPVHRLRGRIRRDDVGADEGDDGVGIDRHPAAFEVAREPRRCAFRAKPTPNTRSGSSAKSTCRSHVLRERLGEGSFTYAYPYGDVNEWVVDLLTRQNVSQGVTVTPGGNGFFAYPYMLRRTHGVRQR